MRLNHAIPADIAIPTLSMLLVLTMTALCQFSIPVLAPLMAPALGVPSTLVGAFTSIVYAVAMVTGAITGALVDRLGAALLLQLTLLAAALGLGLLATAVLPLTLLSAVLLGSAYGPYNPASAQILSERVTPKCRPLVFSIKQLGVPLGGMLAGVTIPVLALTVGWRLTLVVVATLTLLAIPALRSLRRSTGGATAGERLGLRSALLGSLTLPLRHQALRYYTLAAFLFAGCQMALGAFFVVYLVESVGLSLLAAGSVFAALQIGGVVGRLTWGFAASHWLSPRYLLAGLSLSIAGLLAAVTTISAEWPWFSLLLFGLLLGLCSFGWNGVLLSEITRLAHSSKAAEVTGGVQFFMFGGVVVVPPLFGALVTSSGHYEWGFAMIAVAAAANAALMLLASQSR